MLATDDAELAVLGTILDILEPNIQEHPAWGIAYLGFEDRSQNFTIPALFEFTKYSLI